MFSHKGMLSLMRGLSGLVVVTGCYAIVHQLWFFETVDYLGPTGVILAGLGGKAVQRQIEAKEA